MCSNPRIHLALEYCGKVISKLDEFCTNICICFQVAKIRQLTLGPSNPATIRSLDMFTVLYAEAGRQQYAGESKTIFERANEVVWRLPH